MRRTKSVEERIADKIMKLVHTVLLKTVKPDMTIGKVSELDAQEIERIKKEYGIEAIILDVDETLRANMKRIPDANKEWIETIRDKIKIIILSNGIDRNVEEYFAQKGIDYIGFAHKPFKKNFVKACQKLNVKPENVMVVGDSLFDDVYGGKKNNMKTALVMDVER